jgi:SPP1 gp7 family putative phage head morphogenesis protein
MEFELLRRLRLLERTLRDVLVTRNVLGLGPPIRGLAVEFPPIRGWAGLSEAERQRRFGEWLYNVVDDLVIDSPDLASLAIPGGWQRTFLRRAYVNGVTMTTTALRRAGRDIVDQTAAQIFNSPFHRGSLESLFERNLAALRGFTNTMAAGLQNMIADAILTGENPRALGADIAKRFELSGNRGRTIARSEVIRANAVGQLNTFKQFGERGVQLQAEFLTAGDDRVCEECAGLEGEIYDLDEAAGVIPVHPNCRCTWIPLQMEMTEEAA